MTAHVKELTDRATTAAAGAPVTQSARDIRALLDAFVRLGHSETVLLAAAGLDPTCLQDFDARLPLAAWTGLVEAARRRPIPNLGLRAAAATPLGAYPLLDYLVLSCDSVGAGYRQLSRYYALVSSCPLEILEDVNPIRVVFAGAAWPFVAEYALSLSILHFRRETNGRFRPESVSLAHRVDDADEFRRTLGCELRERADWSGVSISPAAWSLPLARRDPILRGMLERQADAVSARKHELDAAGVVRRALTARISGGDVRIESVARQLASSPRTLQRRLAAEGTSYQELRERTRREAAEGYLTASSLSVGEIGYLLGYSEPAAFHRAFRRWHGMTPAQYRRKEGR